MYACSKIFPLFGVLNVASVYTAVLWDSSLNKLCCWCAVQCWTGYWGGKCLSCLWWQGRARSLIETRGAGRHTGTRRPLIGSWGGLSDSLKSLRLDSLIIRAGTVRSWHLVRDSPKTAPVTPRPKNTDKYSTVGGYLAIYVAWEGRQDRMCSKEFVKMLLLSLWPQWRSPGEW